MLHTSKHLILVASLALLSQVSACAGSAGLQTAAVTTAPPQAAVVLVAIGTAYGGEELVGQLHEGPDCEKATAREWSDLIRQRVATELKGVFEREATLRANSSRPPGMAMQATAVLEKLDLQLCQHEAGAWNGSVKLRIGWTVMTPDGNHVLLSTATTGAFTAGQRLVGSTAIAFDAALQISVAKLLDDYRYVALVAPSKATRLAQAF